MKPKAIESKPIELEWRIKEMEQEVLDLKRERLKLLDEIAEAKKEAQRHRSDLEITRRRYASQVKNLFTTIASTANAAQSAVWELED